MSNENVGTMSGRKHGPLQTYVPFPESVGSHWKVLHMGDKGLCGSVSHSLFVVWWRMGNLLRGSCSQRAMGLGGLGLMEVDTGGLLGFD